MDVSDLERQELFELAGLLGDKLGASIKRECILELRVTGLVKALDAARKDKFFSNSTELQELIDRGDWWQERADSFEEDLKNAKDQWAEYTERTESDIQALRQEVVDSEILHKADAETIKNLRLTLEDQRTCLMTKDMGVRRLERELKETRANVMNELSAMIPKAVAAERDACAEVCRQAALQCASPTQSTAIIEVVNAIKGRG
jgi:hypothetical protein